MSAGVPSPLSDFQQIVGGTFEMPIRRGGGGLGLRLIVCLPNGQRVSCAAVGYCSVPSQRPHESASAPNPQVLPSITVMGTHEMTMDNLPVVLFVVASAQGCPWAKNKAQRFLHPTAVAGRQPPPPQKEFFPLLGGGGVAQGGSTKEIPPHFRLAHLN